MLNNCMLERGELRMHISCKLIFVVLFTVPAFHTYALGDSDSHSEESKAVTTLDEFRAERDKGVRTEH